MANICVFTPGIYSAWARWLAQMYSVGAAMSSFESLRFILSA
jgi:hypothetical protein